MKMGLLTNSLTDLGLTDLQAIARWAAAHQIEELDVGPAIPLDEAVFYAAQEKENIKINTLIYCRNFLSEDTQEAATHQEALKARIAFASKMGIEKIVCSTGVTKASFAGMGFAPQNSMDAVVALFSELLRLAEKHNVKLCFENCPMMGNIATSPDVWEELFQRLNSDKIGLCYDPSHLVWQLIDPYQPIFSFKDKIFHVHGKDTQVNWERLSQKGTLQNSQWWRHRLPGLGDLDWQRIVDSLYEIGYDNAICIEHEDPVWSGTEDKVKRGILKTKAHISSFFM